MSTYVSSVSNKSATTNLGVGSGLPLETLLQGLQNSENVKLTAIDKQRIAAKDRITAYGSVQNALSSLNTAMLALGDPAGFGTVKTTVSGSDFTASADPNTVTGDFTVSVSSLAKSQVLTSAGQASKSTPIMDASGTPGSINFTIAGKVTTVDLSSTDGSLASIMSAINSNSALGVRASIVNDGTATPYHLMLTPSNTGTAAAITDITTTGNNALQSVIGYGAGGAGLTQSQPATDAKLKFNGVDITSASNTVTGVMSGLTLNLASNSGQDQKLSIARDDATTTKKINDFVTAYNSVISQVKQQTAYDQASQTKSPLTGDSVILTIQRRINGMIQIQGSGAIPTLSSMGIKSNPPDGSLSVDSAKLATALANNNSEVKSLFQGTNGIVAYAKRLDADLNGSSGAITAAKKSTQTQIRNLTNDYNTMSDRIDASMNVYRNQFTALDALVAQMNGTTSYLTNQLNILNGTQNKA